MKVEPGQVVLVAEDNSVNQYLLRLMLKSMDVQVEVVDNGIQAVNSAQTKTYSLILMDIMMPEMDGFEASVAIRKREFQMGLHTPIIACTALNKEDIMEECIRSGIDDLISKPLSRATLIQKIERWSTMSVNSHFITPEIAGELNGLAANQEFEAIDPDYLKMLYGIEHLDDVFTLFSTVTETLIAQLHSAIRHQDVAVVQRMAHELKSSSLAIDAHDMVRLCLNLEGAGQHQDWTEVERLYITLGLAFARVRAFLQVNCQDDPLSGLKRKTVNKLHNLAISNRNLEAAHLGNQINK